MDGFVGAASSFERYGGIDRQNPGIEGGMTRWRFSRVRITFPVRDSYAAGESIDVSCYKQVGNILTELPAV
ncbi:hypothetical protein ACVK1X_000364 [Pseudomonas sp. PvR086]|jgi:hypothetical protein|uniref:hypothetical protein n=1 Tax=Pseudomonas frederiksbergensis TaxID=104087 RepID=UPI0011AF7AA3|nr:hypothetical protein [Pseudomonas frederiksbergensis]